MAKQSISQSKPKEVQLNVIHKIDLAAITSSSELTREKQSSLPNIKCTGCCDYDEWDLPSDKVCCIIL